MRLDYRALVLIFVAPVAAAHGSADNHLQILVLGDRVKMNIVVDMRVLHIADVDEDGYASLDELAARRERLERWIGESFDVKGDGDRGHVAFADITSDLNIARANGDRVDHARILRTLEFPGPITELQIALSRLARTVPDLKVTVIDAASGRRYTLDNLLEARTVSLRVKSTDATASPSGHFR